MDPDKKDGAKLVKKHTESHVFRFAAEVAFVVVVIGSIASYALGYIYIGVKSPVQAASLKTLVCDKASVIEKINKSIEDSSTGANSGDIKSTVDYIVSQKDYESDPTCVEALARLYYVQADANNLKTQVQILGKLSDQGLYPSNRLNSLSSILNNEVNIESIGD
jgi:hypothetical protein